MRRAVPSVRIDFLQSAAPRSHVSLAMAALGIASVLLVAWAWADAVAAVDALELRSSRVVAAPREHVAASPEDARRAAAERMQIGHINDSLAAPWDALFADLEAANSADAALLSIRPEDEGRSLRLSGEARDFGAVLAYIARLQHARSLSRVLLASHERAPNGAAAAVRFSLTAEWKAR
jgi:Tfp pilus assembly protein PilN